jgi:hypothetical protein
MVLVLPETKLCKETGFNDAADRKIAGYEIRVFSKTGEMIGFLQSVTRFNLRKKSCTGTL